MLNKENLKKIKENEFIKILGIQEDSVDGLQDLDRYEYKAGAGNYKLYYFNFKNVRELLTEIEEIKKLDKSGKDILLWFDYKKLINLLIEKEILSNIDDVAQYEEENIEVLDDIFNELLNKFASNK